MEKVNLAALIAPLPVDDFFRNNWEKVFYHQKRNQPGYFDQILSIADVDDFLSQQNLIPDGIKLMNNGEGIPALQWTKEDTLLDGTIKTVVSTAKIFKFFHAGATIIVNSAEKNIPRLANACQTFEQELKIKVQANIYITPPNAQGFAMHYDPHDIFSMQIKGPKTWRIYDAGEELPTTYRAFRKKPELISQFENNSGDLLYMPRGTVHEAFSSDVSTIHVNFSCRPRYGFHLIEEIARLAEREDVFFRRTVPGDLNSDAEIEAYSEMFKQKLTELLTKVTPENLLKKQFEHFVSNQIFDFKGRLTDSLKLENLNLNSSVSRRKGLTYVVTVGETATKIKFGDCEIKIPNFMEKDLFLQDHPFKIKELKGLLTGSGKLALAKEYIESGFLQIETIE